MEHMREYIADLKGEHEILLACWEFPLVIELNEIENFKTLTLKSYESSLKKFFKKRYGTQEAMGNSN